MFNSLVLTWERNFEVTFDILSVLVFRIAYLWKRNWCRLNISFLTFWGVKMCDKMAISAYILKIVEKDPFLRLKMRAKEMFNRHQFFFYK